jgi:hypothetical protein
VAQIAYKDVVAILLERFPEFKETEEFRWVLHDDLEFPSAVWGGFADYAAARIRRLPIEELDRDEFVARVFNIANELMDRGDEETQNLIVVELFEHFFTYAKTLELARRKLKPEHVQWLNQLDVLLATSEMHYDGELVAPNGLDSLSPLLSGLSWDIGVSRPYPSRDCLPRLEALGDPMSLYMDSDPGPRHCFFGDPQAWTGEEEARRLLGEFSERLARRDVAHRISLYRTGQADILIQRFAHRWPEAES